MRQNHPILQGPLKIDSQNGQLNVLKQQAKEQEDMGEALTLDSVVNSIDAELIATGPSAKGPDRGAIVRHGQYILWGFEGPVSNMTASGQRLFINTVCYAAQHEKSPVLEKLMNGTRDKLYGSLDYARRVPGYLNTIKKLDLPGNMQNATIQDVENWIDQNRPYLRVEGRRQLVVDEFAKQLGIPNHTTAFLDMCVLLMEQNKNAADALIALCRYTGQTDMGASAAAWRNWLSENRKYLYFSDCDGFRFKIDEVAKSKGIATADLRSWSSEVLDYRFHRNSEATEISNIAIQETP